MKLVTFTGDKARAGAFLPGDTEVIEVTGTDRYHPVAHANAVAAHAKSSGADVVVTGATGGVGCMAVQSLAARGYEVTALTGKPAETDFLRAIGAKAVLDRHELQMGTKPLEKASWSGAVDAVGGETLAWLTRTMQYRGCIASSGLAGGHELHTTVMPFILRGVKLLGIDSVMCPAETRLEVWRRLATDLRPTHLDRIANLIGLDDLPSAFTALLKGEAQGRYVVRLRG